MAEPADPRDQGADSRQGDRTGPAMRPDDPGIPEELKEHLEKIFGEVGKNWGWMLALGIGFIVLGFIALGAPVLMTLSTVMLFGVLLLIGGIGQVIEVFKAKGWKDAVSHVLIGLLYIAAAVIIFRNPAMSSLNLTIMLGVLIIAVGVLRIFMGFRLKEHRGWGWLVAGGVISILLGGVILARWPASGLVVIGVLVAIELIIHGWVCVLLALTARKARKLKEAANTA